MVSGLYQLVTGSRDKRAAKRDARAEAEYQARRLQTDRQPGPTDGPVRLDKNGPGRSG